MNTGSNQGQIVVSQIIAELARGNSEGGATGVGEWPARLLDVTASSSSSVSVPLPGVLKFGSLVSVLQGAVAIVIGIFLIVEDFRTMGQEDSLVSESGATNWVGTGTAVFIFIVFGAAIAGTVNILRGRTWGRGPIVLLQILLLFVAFYMFSGGQPAAGAAVGLSALLILVGVLHPKANEWFSTVYGG